MFETIISAYRWLFLRIADIVGLGWGIVALSVICSLLMIPLMSLVAGIVRRETDYQSVILPQIEDIKSRFSSDIDRHLHIRRLYKRYCYSPLSAVKKVLPLFVQVPFLLLTYFMLKGTIQLNGVQFLFLRDLGQPDGLVAALGINVLPVMMTGVNILTVFATPGFTSRDCWQAIGISFLFLIMLYTAPSALLLYWTLNNVITLFRTLLVKGGEGARLLGAHILTIRRIPKFIRSRATDQNIALLGLIALLVALYMRLMVYMRVWFFNRMASYWLMNEVLAVGVVAIAVLYRRKSFIIRLFAWLAAVFSVIAAAFVLTVLMLLPFTLKGMTFVNAHCDLAVVFDSMFLLGILPVMFDSLTHLREVRVSVVKAVSSEAYWLIGIVILSIHYSFASANFKLPLGSVAMLTLYLVLPAMAVSLLAILVMRHHMDIKVLFKIGIGVSLGAYLIPMVSLESGKILGWTSNLVIRFILMGTIAFLVCHIRKRKPVLVFLSVLGVLVIANAGYSKCRVVNEIKSPISVKVGMDAQNALLNAPCSHTNSIYLLVYDGYAPDTILNGMNIRNMGIGTYLRKHGFTSYDAYSVGSDTVVSMGNTFNIGGVVQGSVRSSMAGNNVFCDYLKQHGYTTSFVLCGYDMPNRGERMPGDFYFPTAQKVTRPEMVLYPCIIRGILSQSANTFNSYTREEWLSVKRDLMSVASPRGSFIYAHSDKPGHVVANPTYRKDPETERLMYERRIAAADAELQHDVEMLLSKADDSIVIVASDHGSHLTLPDHENEYDAFTMLDRVGIQLHVRWPHDYTPCLKLDCLQNLFLEIEIYLSGDRSLARFAVQGETYRIQAPLRAPAGAIKNAIIQSGPDKGRNLFEAARSRSKQQVHQ